MELKEHRGYNVDNKNKNTLFFILSYLKQRNPQNLCAKRFKPRKPVKVLDFRLKRSTWKFVEMELRLLTKPKYYFVKPIVKSTLKER